MIEHARSSLSGCRYCDDKITKDDLRFGYFTPDRPGWYGVIIVWFHLQCTPLALLKAERLSDLVPKCKDFSKLSIEYQELVLNWPPGELSKSCFEQSPKSSESPGSESEDSL